ncbi:MULTISPECIES: energy-coupling factor transporter transmembrane protein EcfT [Agromyces]|uniref:Energy-coupling factor transporter transmembrane protein EcfT n=1 Tax=Agromyces indicus TaxID=758919 RepID=A0ABU1FJM5_9MICO|nr:MULTISPECIES: energy-coupling factor transporter transmembrane protein EcfT [Agromyces]KZE95236.1 Energy-coupling factor transporter transmembrane protein BioN [Agromyces sp. NDB4Y10]MCK8608850.1 energy-coupling factor transporter transmembrane protein EcfT [Agromyces sp. C10]MDR5691938.1 energy-coupling factor transporter transmembrane protein EcfT [Agromyces indicus]
MIGVFHPGTSVVHRAPALVKLGLLAVIVTTVALLPSLPALGAASVVVVALFALARVPFRVAWRQVSPILWILAFAVPVQWIFAGWEAAATMGVRLVLAVALAAVYTLTTPVTATLDAMQVLLRPFRRWIDADRVGLALALAIRCVPLLADLVREVLDARKARGAEGSPTAFAVPVIVRALRTADHLGEALMARGVDD